MTFSAAIENPSSDDVGGDVEQARTPAPDVMASLALERGKLTRVELSGLARRLQVLLPNGSTPSATAWGAQLSAVVEPISKHELRVAGLVGDGIGRYLQGLDAAAPFHPTAAGQLAIALTDQAAVSRGA